MSALSTEATEYIHKRKKELETELAFIEEIEELTTPKKKRKHNAQVNEIPEHIWNAVLSGAVSLFNTHGSLLPQVAGQQQIQAPAAQQVQQVLQIPTQQAAAIQIPQPVQAPTKALSLQPLQLGTGKLLTRSSSNGKQQ